MKEAGNGNKRTLLAGETPWNKIPNRPTTPQGPRSDTHVTWEPLNAPPVRELPRTRVAPRERLTQEEHLRIQRFEEDIRYARKGLDQIREAFDYKAQDPNAPLGADIDSWSRRYGQKKETWTEMLGRWSDSLDARLRDDARRYFVLEGQYEQLKKDFAAFKQARGLS